MVYHSNSHFASCLRLVQASTACLQYKCSPPHLRFCATHTFCSHLQACLSLGPAQGQGDRCSPSQEAAEAPTDHQGQRGSCSPSVRIKQYFIVALLILTIVYYYWLGAPAQHISQEALEC